MCRECQRRRWEKKLIARNKLGEKYGFTDEHGDGFGWWSSPEAQARIVSRQQAWKALGFHATWLPFYSFLPSIAKSIGEQIKTLPNLGETTYRKLQLLGADADERFLKVYNQLYENPDSWVWKHVRSNFKRLEETNRI